MTERGRRWSWRKRLGLALVCGLILYVGSYGMLSVRGSYQPYVWGAAGPKRICWCPSGFMDEKGWRLWVWRFYAPLHAVDRFCWHKDPPVANAVP